MMVSSPDRNAAIAAEIALAMVRFAQAELPESRVQVAADRTERFTLHPLGQPLDRHQLVQHLVALPKPVLLVPSLPKGTIASWTAHDLSTHHRQRMDHEVKNQLIGVAEMMDSANGSKEQRIVLATDQDELVFGRSVLDEWASTYAVLVGWNLRRRSDTSLANYQMVLTDGCGRWTYPPNQKL